MMKWLLLLFFYPLIVYGTKGDCNTHFEDDKKHILPISKRGDVNIQKIPRKNPSGEMESSLYKNQTQNTMVSEDDNPFLPPVKKIAYKELLPGNRYEQPPALDCGSHGFTGGRAFASKLG